MITINCDNCGIECLKKQDQMDKYTNHFCSRECHYEWKRNNDTGDDHPLAKPIYVNCRICEKEIRSTPARLEKQKYSYCSRGCQHIGHSIDSSGITMFVVSCGQCGGEIKVDIARYNMYHKRSENPQFFCSEECRAKYWSENFCGENSGTWKGGITKLQKAVRSQSQYYKWRDRCMDRDDYMCQSCGDVENLIVHHIEEMQKIINKNDITTPKEARECDELWDISNGLTLCNKCHKKVHRRGVYK